MEGQEGKERRMFSRQTDLKLTVHYYISLCRYKLPLFEKTQHTESFLQLAVNSMLARFAFSLIVKLLKILHLQLSLSLLAALLASNSWGIVLKDC